MSSMPNPTVTTAEELLLLHEPGFRHELVRGELRRMSPAGHWHGGAGATLTELLVRHAREHNLGKTYMAETGFLLACNPDTVLAPDISFVCNERLPPTRTRGYFPGPPDLAVEVRSPEGTRRQLHEKVLSWLRHGTRMVWVVDPAKESVTVYRGTDEVHELREGDEIQGGDVLPGFRVLVRDLFPTED
ncbi:MAG TPA: Uma2 family endonuclease [Planctomycetota bacterium]|nr:Uma2 family endonuclease [Planctomycetota bacterium]